ncbi:hypothetical protein L6E12_01335 [Actinokineospora sp. PR83]|uniref:methyltransferase domain-containing protein n=1 Tax=Actinokineospora sp. PR83 TaxID=2884908 RepID=UPI001F1FE274|nr:methyltransferase domain-containing protein [Actinokineospora sp. PR83]MCG8914439.1 hypothetical protein [Actinokineospora sp. PR83]
MSMFDALPLARRLLDALDHRDLTVVDVGCGDGSFLAELVGHRTGVTGVGFEPDPDGFGLAQKQVAARGLAAVIDLRNAGALSAVEVDVPEGREVCFMAAFVLQEVLEQEGEQALRAMLERSVARNPGAHWLVIEVDHRPQDPAVMRHGLGVAYYNPYYLLHVLTEQRLAPRAFWERLFDSAGLEVLAVAHPDEQIDSTGLEVGYLLRARVR